MNKYPELAKMKAAKHDSQLIGEFLDWLKTEKGYVLARFEKNYSHDLILVTRSIEDLLAEYFEIDLQKVEREKMAVLEKFRKEQNLK